MADNGKDTRARSRYAKVHNRIWRSQDFRQLNEDGKSLFIYLLTSPHLNMVGFYYLPLAYIADDLQWPFERVAKGLRNCIERGVISYDHDTSVILIHNYLKYNPIENPNQAKGAVNILLEMPQTALFLDFLNCIETHIERFINHFETLRERYAKPVTVTVTVPVTVAVEQRVSEPIKAVEPEKEKAAAAPVNLPEREQEKINRLRAEYPADLVDEACRRADKRQKLKFSYVQGILQDWYFSGLTTLQAVLQADPGPDNRQQAAQQAAQQVQDDKNQAKKDAEARRRAEKVQAACDFIKLNLQTDFPNSDDLEKVRVLAGEYGPDAASEIIASLYPGVITA